MFAVSESIDSQLGRFAKLRSEDPELAKQQHEVNERLVNLCQEGSFRKVKELVEYEGGKLMTYFVVRAFKAALMGCHLVLADFLISNGYPLNSSGVPYVLLEVIADLQGENKDEIIVSILQFLVSKQWDVNMQASKTWVSALHMTVQSSLLESTRVLLQAGADVNAVAHSDALPLSVAEQAIASLERKKTMGQGTEGVEIIGGGWGEDQKRILAKAEAVKSLLLIHGAKSTWRRFGSEPEVGTFGYSAGSELSSSAVARSNCLPPPTPLVHGLVRFTGSAGLQQSGLVRMTGGGGGLVSFSGGSLPPTPGPGTESAGIASASTSTSMSSSSSALVPNSRSWGAGQVEGEDSEDEISGGNNLGPNFSVQDDGGLMFSTGK